VADILISKTQQSQNPSKREAMIKKNCPKNDRKRWRRRQRKGEA